MGGDGAAGCASGGGGDGVDHERAMLAGGPAGFGACVEAFTFLVGHEIVALVCDEGEDLLGGVGPSGELGEACGEEVVAFGGSSELVARRVAGEAVLALLEGESGELSAVGSAGGTSI